MTAQTDVSRKATLAVVGSVVDRSETNALIAWIVSQFNKAHRRELLFPGLATLNAFALLPTPEV
ncbi:hypothetical protein [Roseiarcus sp.]|uniref:hypothetical protein n=1 Tax=Roseiarcus sp. TaxID=1969460 RepID=UPI003F9D087B